MYVLTVGKDSQKSPNTKIIGKNIPKLFRKRFFFFIFAFKTTNEQWIQVKSESRILPKELV